MNTHEEWRDVVGYKGVYHVSSLGRIKSLPRVVFNGYVHRHLRARILKIQRDTKGYPIVRLNVDGRGATRKVHQLVAEAFLGPCPDGLQVNHKNGDKSDNRIENLEYVTPSANMLHASRTHLRTYRNGSKHHCAKLDEAQVREIKSLLRTGNFSKTDLGRRYGVDRTTISAIAHGKNWRHIT